VAIDQRLQRPLGRPLRPAARRRRDGRGPRAADRAHDGEVDDVVPRRADPAEDPPGLVDRLEQPLRVGDALDIAEEQEAVLLQREVEEADKLPLQLRLQVDQHVAADNEVGAREGRSCARFCGAKIITSRNSGLTDTMPSRRSNHRSRRSGDRCCTDAAG
jgi:hypothetical protein